MSFELPNAEIAAVRESPIANSWIEKGELLKAIEQFEPEAELHISLSEFFRTYGQENLASQIVDNDSAYVEASTFLLRADDRLNHFQEFESDFEEAKLRIALRVIPRLIAFHGYEVPEH